MASYCEVCQSTCFPPHQHALLLHRLSSSSSPSVPLPPPRGSTRSVSPLSHGRAVHVEQRSTTPSCGLVSSHPRRSGSVPCAAPAVSTQRWAAAPTALRSSCQLRSFSEPVRRFPRRKDATSFPSHRLRAPTPPPLPASVLRRRANQNAGDAGRGFAVDTFNSLLRAEGSIPPFDFMRRGEGIVGTRHPSRPPSQTSSPLSPSRSPTTGFLDTFDPHRALAERCCYPSLLPDAHRRHTDERVAQCAHRDAHPSDSTDRSGTTSSSLPVEEAARPVPAPTVGVEHPDATKHRFRLAPKVENHEHGHRGFSPVSPTGASTTPVVSMREHVNAAQQRHPRHNSHDSERSSTPQTTRPHAKASPSAHRPSSPAQLSHPLGDLIEMIRAEVRADAALGQEKLQAKTEKREKRKETGQAGATSATTQREAAKAAEEDAGGSPTTSCPVSSIEFSHAAAKRAKQHAAVPKHEAGRKDAPHQSAALYTSGSDAMSSSDDEEKEGRSSGKDTKHPPRLQSRPPNTPHKARHTSVPREESRSRSVTQRISHHRRRRASSSSSSASSLPSASSSASSVSRSSSAQLRRAVQEAQNVLQQMRQRARERGEAENSNEGQTKKGRRRTLSRHSGADVGGGDKREEETAGRRRQSHARSRLGQMTAEDDDGGFLNEASPSPSKDARHESRRRSHSRALSQTRHPRAAAAAAETGAVRPLKEIITPAQAALVEEEVRATLPRITAKLERQQADWCGEQDHRIERLREGLASLCVAVRKDLRKMREEVEALREQVGEAAAARRAEASRRPAPHPGAAAQPRPETFSPECVVTWVGQSSASDKRRLAHLLFPHLQPALADVIEAEVRCQLRTVTAEQQTQQRDAEARLHAYVDAAITTADTKRSLERDDGGGATAAAAAAAAAGAPIWAGFSSADAFDAHLRATARAVLVEEDDRRYSLVNENERRHELRVREMQQHWQDTLAEAELAWRAAWKAMLDKAGEAWRRRTQAPLQEHADLLQTIVTALTRDVTHLQAQQDAQAAAVHEMLRTEREMRQQEQAKLKERVEQRVVQLLPREVESACVRYHVQRERQASTALRGTRVASLDGGGGGSPLSASPAAQLTAEELRLSVVQPALDHMRRLLVSHQEMMSAAVEDRCCRAERAVEGSRHVWLQNVTELRGKVSALRSDVRGAFNELCTSLNVASPAM